MNFRLQTSDSFSWARNCDPYEPCQAFLTFLGQFPFDHLTESYGLFPEKYMKFCI